MGSPPLGTISMDLAVRYSTWNCTQIIEKFFNSKAENYFEHFSREWWQKASHTKTAWLTSELQQLLSSLFCAIFPIVSTCHPMTLLGAKSYLGLPPPHCAHGFTRLQMSSSLTIARRVGSDTSATATAAVPYRLINPGWELPCHLTKTASKQT